MTLRDEVAQAIGNICIREGKRAPWRGLGACSSENSREMADAAIALVLERAAQRAEEWYDGVHTHTNLLVVAIAAAIRGLK